MSAATSESPFTRAAPVYRRAGWVGVLKLPHGKKANPPEGFTGEEGGDADEKQIEEWRAEGGNIGLRMPPGVVGIDFDDYKDAGAARAALEAKLGPLPPTWRSTSRDDGSAIVFYRLAEPVKLHDKPATCIEIIQHHHRYAVAAPSVHPDTGAEYRWIDPEGEITRRPPRPVELPKLPGAWFEHLRADRPSSNGEKRERPRREGSAREWAPAVTRVFGEACADFAQSRHDTACSATVALARFSERDFPGADEALVQLERQFVAAATRPGPNQRSDASARREWGALLAGAWAKVHAEPAEIPRWSDDDLAWVRAAEADDGTEAADGGGGWRERLEAAARVDPDASEALAEAVAGEMKRQLARAYAREILEHQDADDTYDDGYVADLDDTPLQWRIEGVLPAGGRGLVVAQRKTGKTTLLLNAARSLVTGETFLEAFDVEPIAGNVGFLNFEVSGAQFRQWATDARIPGRRLYVNNLRGHANPFRTEAARARLAERLRQHDVEVLIIDPYARATTANDLDKTADTIRWINAVEEVARDAGIGELLVANHAGWVAGRGRNSSALEDWPDSLILLTKHDDDLRYLKAEGRDVDVKEDRLDYDALTRRLRLTGYGSRRKKRQEGRAADLAGPIVAAVTDRPGINAGDLRDAVRGTVGKASNAAIDAAAEALAEAAGGPITRRQGDHNAWHYYPAGWSGDDDGNSVRHSSPDSVRHSSPETEPLRHKGSPSSPQFADTSPLTFAKNVSEAGERRTETDISPPPNPASERPSGHASEACRNCGQPTGRDTPGGRCDGCLKRDGIGAQR